MVKYRLASSAPESACCTGWIALQLGDDSLELVSDHWANDSPVHDNIRYFAKCETAPGFWLAYRIFSAGMRSLIPSAQYMRLQIL